MLLQSHEGEIVLLPALPKEWKNGRVSGLRARGGFEISLEWKAGILIKAVITADKDSKAVVRYGQRKIALSLTAHTAQKLDFA